jgi:hypothetical protein
MLLSRLLFVFVASYAFALQSDKLCSMLVSKAPNFKSMFPPFVMHSINPFQVIKPYACIVCSDGIETTGNLDCDKALSLLVPFSQGSGFNAFIDILYALHDCVEKTPSPLSSSDGCKVYS